MKTGRTPHTPSVWTSCRLGGLYSLNADSSDLCVISSALVDVGGAWEGACSTIPDWGWDERDNMIIMRITGPGLRIGYPPIAISWPDVCKNWSEPYVKQNERILMSDECSCLMALDSESPASHSFGIRTVTLERKLRVVTSFLNNWTVELTLSWWWWEEGEETGNYLFYVSTSWLTITAATKPIGWFPSMHWLNIWLWLIYKQPPRSQLWLWLWPPRQFIPVYRSFQRSSSQRSQSLWRWSQSDQTLAWTLGWSSGTPNKTQSYPYSKPHTREVRLSCQIPMIRCRFLSVQYDYRSMIWSLEDSSYPIHWLCQTPFPSTQDRSSRPHTHESSVGKTMSCTLLLILNAIASVC